MKNLRNLFILIVFLLLAIFTLNWFSQWKTLVPDPKQWKYEKLNNKLDNKLEYFFDRFSRYNDKKKLNIYNMIVGKLEQIKWKTNSEQKLYAINYLIESINDKISELNNNKWSSWSNWRKINPPKTEYNVKIKYRIDEEKDRVVYYYETNISEREIEKVQWLRNWLIMDNYKENNKFLISEWLDNSVKVNFRITLKSWEIIEDELIYPEKDSGDVFDCSSTAIDWYTLYWWSSWKYTTRSKTENISNWWILYKQEFKCQYHLWKKHGSEKKEYFCNMWFEESWWECIRKTSDERSWSSSSWWWNDSSYYCQATTIDGYSLPNWYKKDIKVALKYKEIPNWKVQYNQEFECNLNKYYYTKTWSALWNEQTNLICDKWYYWLTKKDSMQCISY